MRNFISRELEEWRTKYFLLSILLLGVLLLRIPGLFEPYWYGDEAIFLTVGQALRQNLVLYRDIHDNKPPLIYQTAMIAGNQAGFRAILLIWMVTATIVLWRLSCRLFSQRVALVTTAIFGVLTSVPLLEGNIPNGEIFFLPATIAGVFLVFHGLFTLKGRSSLPFFLAGLVIAAGSLFKVPAAFEGFGLGLFLVLLGLKSANERRQHWVNSAWLFIGFSSVWLATLAFEFRQGAGSNFLSEAVRQNIGYLGSWGGSTARASLWTSPVAGHFAAAAGISVALMLLQKKLGNKAVFLGVWFVWALFGALLSGRPYPHYFLEIVAPLALLSGLALARGQAVPRITAGAVLIVSVIYLQQNLTFYPVVAYYRNFAAFLLGRISAATYRNSFDPGVATVYSLAEYVDEHTAPGQRIFIWGDEARVYALARRLPVGRYTTAYHIYDFDPGGQETLQYLTGTPPPIIIWMNDHSRPFPGLAQLISAAYTREATIGSATIYVKIPIL